MLDILLCTLTSFIPSAICYPRKLYLLVRLRNFSSPHPLTELQISVGARARLAFFTLGIVAPVFGVETASTTERGEFLFLLLFSVDELEDKNPLILVSVLILLLVEGVFGSPVLNRHMQKGKNNDVAIWCNISTTFVLI